MYQKTGWSDFNKLRVNDSTLNEGTNSLISKRIGQGRWFIMRCCTTSAIKLAMEWRRLFTPLLVG